MGVEEDWEPPLPPWLKNQQADLARGQQQRERAKPPKADEFDQAGNASAEDEDQTVRRAPRPGRKKGRAAKPRASAVEGYRWE